MAASAYFEKVSESETEIRYRFGSIPSEWTGDLIIDKESGQPADLPAVTALITARMAFNKIVRMQHDSGIWPNGGQFLS